MKMESVIAKIQSGWKLVVSKTGEEVSAVIQSPYEVPDSTDKVFHKPVIEGGGPENARTIPLTLAVPPQHLAGLMALTDETESYETNEKGVVTEHFVYLTPKLAKKPAPAAPPVVVVEEKPVTGSTGWK